MYTEEQITNIRPSPKYKLRIGRAGKYAGSLKGQPDGAEILSLLSCLYESLHRIGM